MNLQKTNYEEKPMKKPKSEKRKYSTPKVKSESLMVYGAICNGMSSAGGRKASVAPGGCAQARLHS